MATVGSLPNPIADTLRLTRNPEYTIPFYQLDLVYEATQYPKFLDIGGNTGEPNTFTGVNITDLTAGVYNGETLLQGNNLFCLGYQMAQAGLTDQLELLGGTLTKLISQISPQAGSAIADLGCPVSGAGCLIV